MEQLYIEVLYTIANTVGASTGQYAHYKEDLYRYAQEAFGVPQDQHRRYLNIASEEKVYSFINFSLQHYDIVTALQKMCHRYTVIYVEEKLNKIKFIYCCSHLLLC